MTPEIIFFWIGLGVSMAIGSAVVVVAAIWLYRNLIADRFGCIFFRKTKRRLSIASWHETRLLAKGQSADDATGADEWPADDHVIGERPFYLSAKFWGKRWFALSGTIADRRTASIAGRHPDHDAR